VLQARAAELEQQLDEACCGQNDAVEAAAAARRRAADAATRAEAALAERGRQLTELQVHFLQAPAASAILKLDADADSTPAKDWLALLLFLVHCLGSVLHTWEGLSAHLNGIHTSTRGWVRFSSK